MERPGSRLTSCPLVHLRSRQRNEDHGIASHPPAKSTRRTPEKYLVLKDGRAGAALQIPAGQCDRNPVRDLDGKAVHPTQHDRANAPLANTPN